MDTKIERERPRQRNRPQCSSDNVSIAGSNIMGSNTTEGGAALRERIQTVAPDSEEFQQRWGILSLKNQPSEQNLVRRTHVLVITQFVPTSLLSQLIHCTYITLPLVEQIPTKQRNFCKRIVKTLQGLWFNIYIYIYIYIYTSIYIYNHWNENGC